MPPAITLLESSAMTETFNRILDSITGWIFEMIVQPAMYELGLMDWADDAIDWIQFGLFGIASIVVVYVVCRPLEAWRPVEPVTDRRAIRTDIFYTLLTRLGVLPLVAFVLLNSLSAWWAGLVADSGFVPPTLETLIPGLREMPILAFCLYIVILDFGEYWRHRFQHRLGWWWALHSIHHAQRQMTFWTDDRNHILDEMLAALWFGAIALAIGVPPGQFPLLVMPWRAKAPTSPSCMPRAATRPRRSPGILPPPMACRPRPSAATSPMAPRSRNSSPMSPPASAGSTSW